MLTNYKHFHEDLDLNGVENKYMNYKTKLLSKKKNS